MYLSHSGRVTKGPLISLCCFGVMFLPIRYRIYGISFTRKSPTQQNDNHRTHTTDTGHNGHTLNIHTHFVGFINYRQTFFNRKHNRHMPVTVIAVVAVCIKHVLWLGMFSHSNITYMDQFHSVICDACHCVVVR